MAVSASLSRHGAHQWQRQAYFSGRATVCHDNNNDDDDDDASPDGFRIVPGFRTEGQKCQYLRRFQAIRGDFSRHFSPFLPLFRRFMPPKPYGTKLPNHYNTFVPIAHHH